MPTQEELKILYDKALKESVKANDDKNKIVIDELRVKIKKLRSQVRNSIRGEERLEKRKITIARALVNMQLDNEINITEQQIADRCSVTLQYIKNTFCIIKRKRR